jgi:hypothetical protein
MGESDGGAGSGAPAWREARSSLVRYLDHGGDPADLDAAIALLRPLAGPGPDAGPPERRAQARLLLGVLLVVRVLPEGLLRSGTPTFETAMRLFTGWSPPGTTALDEGIEHLTHAAEGALLPAQMHALARGLLGTALIFKGMSGGGGTDMERALGLMSEAMTGLPTGESFTSGEGLELPDLMRALVGLTADGQDGPARSETARLETALDALGQARDALAGHPLGDYLTGAFGETLARRAYLTGRFADFEKAWEHVTEALEELDRDDHLLHDHLVYDELLRTLAGVTVSHAAHTFDHGRIEDLVRLSARVLARAEDDPEAEGRDRFLAGMALALRSMRDRSRADEAAAIDHLRRAADRLPPGDPLVPSVVGLLGGLLFDRYGREGDLQDSAAAGVYFDLITRALKESRSRGETLDATTEAAVLGMGTYARAVHGWRTGDAGALASARAELRSLAERLPRDHDWHARVRTSLGVTLIVHARLGGAPEELGEGLGILAEEAETAAAALAEGGTGSEVVDTPAADISGLLARGGCALAALALIADDPDADARLDRAIELLVLSLDARLARPGEATGASARLHWALGTVFLARYDRRRGRGDEQDLSAGIASLERSRELSAGRPGDPSRAACLQRLALLYRDLADTGRAIEVGMEALRAHADDVLLQADPEGALTVARGAAELSQAMAGWCLDEGRPQDAVTALELGRGLVLHAATETRDLPEVLDGLGEADLAARWRAEQAKPPAAPWDRGVTGLRPKDGPVAQLFGEILGMEPPDDLRARTLEALSGEVRTAPSADAVARAVRTLGSDALVYLLRDPDGGAGRALVVAANGAVSSVGLPRLDASGDGPIAEFVQAEAALRPDDRDDGPAMARRDAALESLCDWAGDAVRPLVDHALSWGLEREPRLALVPCGVLGLVPWHAAALVPDGSRRVLHELVVTYGAAGRQLIDVAGREAVDPRRNPVFVSNPSGEFFCNASAVKDLRRHYYPGSLRYGRPCGSAEGAGTAEEVLGWLPGAAGHPGREPASMIQFGCHALAARPAARSFLELAGGERLEVSHVLRQARRAGAGAGGGMVILCACSSDPTEADHDEALTPATAFVAGGAVTVLGARWAVLDSRSALLTFMFHHHLREGRAPADALRLAQLWMLDPGRRPPSRMSALLTDRASDARLADIASWGSFALQGRGR